MKRNPDSLMNLWSKHKRLKEGLCWKKLIAQIKIYRKRLKNRLIKILLCMQTVCMMSLSDNQRDQLKAQHKRERDKTICDRIKAGLLYDKGWTIPAITEALLLSDDAIREHILERRLLMSRQLEISVAGSMREAG